MTFRYVRASRLFVNGLGGSYRKLQDRGEHPIVAVGFPFFRVAIRASMVQFSGGAFGVSLDRPLLCARGLLIEGVTNGATTSSRSRYRR